jgi:hypothetical protein
VDTWEDTAQSEQFMLQALAHPQTNVDTLVSAYRYFFYKSKNAMARHLALQVMATLLKTEGLPQEWELLEPILQARLADPPIRLYLSAYTALGVMLARWGAYQAAMEIAQRIRRLDDRDEFGAGALITILQAWEDEDALDDDET